MSRRLPSGLLIHLFIATNERLVAGHAGTSYFGAMKTLGTEPEQFITDAKGERVGVLLNLKTYERLREAEEELADIQSYDAARSTVLTEVKSGQFATLSDYQAARARKRK